MLSATIHITHPDVQLAGSYEPTGDVLYLAALTDDKLGAAQETPEGHAVRLGTDGQVTHVTLINARWLLDRNSELVATLSDGRRLRLRREDVASIIPRATSPRQSAKSP